MCSLVQGCVQAVIFSAVKPLALSGPYSSVLLTISHNYPEAYQLLYNRVIAQGIPNA
jgi:hypothetical protein